MNDAHLQVIEDLAEIANSYYTLNDKYGGDKAAKDF